jgi:hypothetical protein
MTLRSSLIIVAAGAALVAATPAAADSWGADRAQSIARVSPDLADRAEAAQQADLARMLDARERSQATRAAATTPERELAHDDHFRLNPSSVHATAAATAAGNDLDWQQIGLGFAGGVVLVLGLLVALRVPRHRVPAH